MSADPRLREYMKAVRSRVCEHCTERPLGGPPCLPLGKWCGVEINFPELVEAVQQQTSDRIEPYAQSLHQRVCRDCINRSLDECPCPLEKLLPSAVQAIEEVAQQRRARGESDSTI